MHFTIGEAMSRTYRRKNYHLSKNTSWSGYTKQWGRDTASRFVCIGGTVCQSYCEKTKAEKIFDFLHNHTDKGNYSNKSPKRYYRQWKKAMEKTNFKKQLAQWKKDPDYEIISQMRIASDNWSWY